ncbi:MAG: YggS family pyridoxal phosphate-dependent enzyme [Aestuariivita sp.]|nr:YggS family pyridoxal phosphate-dependent enzyme [Aestuariivita sp.]
MSLIEVQSRIKKAALKADRNSDEIKLIAVSKKQPNDRVESVVDQGHRIFGENRVQEAMQKWPSHRKKYSDIEIHIIGHLQTNKARQAMKIAQFIHSVDRSKLAQTLAKLAQETGNCPDLFIQVNTGEEPQKTGIFPTETTKFVTSCRQMDLPVCGLMCIPPINEEPALHFALLKKLAERTGLTYLSMGMSEDFETAIRFGATHVRIGSAIFGPRE